MHIDKDSMEGRKIKTADVTWYYSESTKVSLTQFWGDLIL